MRACACVIVWAGAHAQIGGASVPGEGNAASNWQWWRRWLNTCRAKARVYLARTTRGSELARVLAGAAGEKSAHATMASRYR